MILNDMIGDGLFMFIQITFWTKSRWIRQPFAVLQLPHRSGNPEASNAKQQESSVPNNSNLFHVYTLSTPRNH